jgi:uncharacterized repeat protein (TIGR02543 family)
MNAKKLFLIVTGAALIINGCTNPFFPGKINPGGVSADPEIQVNKIDINIDIDLSDIECIKGDDVTLTVNVEAADGEELTYQWYSNTEDSNEGGTLVEGAADASYSPPTDKIGTVYYYVAVTKTRNGRTAEAVSGTIKVTVNEGDTGVPVINIDIDLSDIECIKGDDVTLTVTVEAADDEEVTYRWYSNTEDSNESGTLVEDAEDASYKPSTDEIGTVYYYVAVTKTRNGRTAEAASGTIKVTVNELIVLYGIVIEKNSGITGDTVTVTPDTAVEGDVVTISCTVANTAHYNQLDFDGVSAGIDSVESAGGDERTYTVNAADAVDGVITIIAVFTHTDLEIDHITFEDTTAHITVTYGVRTFTNAITNAHHGTGAVTYSSGDETVAIVGSAGVVTILKAGTAVITAEKAADAVYAYAEKSYTLTAAPKPVTISGLSANNKVYNGTTAAVITGTAVINGLISGDVVTVRPGTAAFANANAGNNKTVTFSGYSLTGANAGNYVLTAQPSSVTANITKAPGAAVTIPTVNGTPELATIYISAVSLQTATGQSVEYAISTAGNGTGLSAWQSGTTFTGLYASTVYYIYARSASNTNYEAGTIRVSAEITTAGFRIMFNSNGGSSVPGQIIVAGSTVSYPTNPTRGGYVFYKWYTNSTLTFTYDFGAPVTEDINLYAKWISNTDVAAMAAKDMIWIPGGKFTMGSPSSEPNRNSSETQHTVTLSGFYMGRYQVTQEKYQAVMGSNPSGFKTAVSGESGTPGKLPVENVSWYNAIVFCNKLSIAEGLSPAYSINGSTNPTAWGTVPTSRDATWDAVIVESSSTGYRLPTEAQREYACRAGTTTAYNTGNVISDNTGWYESNSGSKTHQVGLKPANAWGLYDMHGNVWEWCWDWYGAYATGAQTDPMGASSGTQRVRRDGSWFSWAEFLRSAYRSGHYPHNRTDDVGFRLVRP